VDSLERDSLLLSFYCYFARNVESRGDSDCPYCDHFLRAFIIGYEPRNFCQREEDYDKLKQKDNMAEANQATTIFVAEKQTPAEKRMALSL
jgi:hypothetical protein